MCTSSPGLQLFSWSYGNSPLYCTGYEACAVVMARPFFWYQNVGLEEFFECARVHSVCNYSLGVMEIVHYSVRMLKHAQF